MCIIFLLVGTPYILYIAHCLLPNAWVCDSCTLGSRPKRPALHSLLIAKLHRCHNETLQICSRCGLQLRHYKCQCSFAMLASMVRCSLVTLRSYFLLRLLQLLIMGGYSVVGYATHWALSMYFCIFGCMGRLQKRPGCDVLHSGRVRTRGDARQSHS